MESYVDRFTERVERLKNIDGVTVTHFTINEPVSSEEFEKLREEAYKDDETGLKLPDDLCAFYRLTDGLSLRWIVDPDGEHTSYEEEEPKLDIKMANIEIPDYEDEEIDRDETKDYVINICPAKQALENRRVCYFDIDGNDRDLDLVFVFSLPNSTTIDLLLDIQEKRPRFWYTIRDEDNDWNDELCWNEYTNAIKYPKRIASISTYLEELLHGIDYFIANHEELDTSSGYEYTKSIRGSNPKANFTKMKDERVLTQDEKDGGYSVEFGWKCICRRLYAMSFCCRYDDQIVPLYPALWTKTRDLVLESRQPVDKNAKITLSTGRFGIKSSWFDIEIGENVAVTHSDDKLIVTLKQAFDPLALIDRVAGMGSWYQFTEENRFERIGCETNDTNPRSDE
jgi:hypothetical protein